MISTRSRSWDFWAMARTSFSQGSRQVGSAELAMVRPALGGNFSIPVLCLWYRALSSGRHEDTDRDVDRPSNEEHDVKTANDLFRFDAAPMATDRTAGWRYVRAAGD